MKVLCLMAPENLSIPDRMTFQQLVWEIVRLIPPGEVTTYGRIAGIIPPIQGMSEQAYSARGARMVGGAMAACPSNVPWHRVINSQGKVSLRKGGGGAEQRTRLELEGVVFDEKDRVDFNKYLWQGPSDEWLVEHGLKE
jgi:methylated-DNA-protein-cysteine methyltransferase-like protein